jgi:hypothetical protein
MLRLSHIKSHLSPLRHVPGPFLAKTSKWLSYHDLAGSRAATLHGVHNKFGTIIHIAPDELSFSDSAIIKETYSQRRKLLGNAFTKSSILPSEPLVAEQIREVHGLR